MGVTAWERVQIARHPKRPHSSDFIKELFTDFEELSGDRLGFNDQAIIGGLAKFEGLSCVVIGQEKGSTTEERIKRNFGYMYPDGYRKAQRLMKLAEKFSIPIITLIDTPGAYPGIEAEERGQASAIADNLSVMSQLQTPIISIIIGEGSSGGAIGIAVSDVIAMLEHAYYSVITPEGCASILWKDVKKGALAADALKLNSEHLLKLGIIDKIIFEPKEGMENDPQITYNHCRAFIKKELQRLKKLTIEQLVEKRYQKFRKL